MSHRSINGPPCPKPERLRTLAEVIESDRELTAVENADLLDALDWLATSLENRNLYHKKQVIKNKIIRSLARDYGLDDEVNKLTDDALHTFVSNQKPEGDEIEIEFPEGEGS